MGHPGYLPDPGGGVLPLEGDGLDGEGGGMGLDPGPLVPLPVIPLLPLETPEEPSVPDPPVPASVLSFFFSFSAVPRSLPVPEPPVPRALVVEPTLELRPAPPFSSH